MQPGNVLIQGGTPDHAVLVDVDVAVNPISHQQYVRLAQRYMPAQRIHLLCNAKAPGRGAGFALPGPDKEEFETPEWTFSCQKLKFSE